MKKSLLVFLILTFLTGTFVLLKSLTSLNSGAPPYDIADNPPVEIPNEYSWLESWERPDGPPKVGLQVGHWKTDEIPEELHRLRGNTGASGGGKSEWEVNMAIANETKSILEERKITVEILPATVPPRYFADVFVAIHADGSLDTQKTGYKTATPRRDLSGKAGRLQTSIEKEYESATSLSKDPNVTRNMRGYYAFGWWRYEHAVHPMTTSLILEAGFLTSPSDREIIVDNPGLSAEGLSKGIISYLKEEDLL